MNFKVLFLFLLEVCCCFGLSVSDKNLSSEIERHLKKWLDTNVLESCSGLRSEFSSLQSELRAVASLASQCADAKDSIRQFENDHTVVHWMKESVAELRHEVAEIASLATPTEGLTSQSMKELRDVVAREVKELRRELQEVKVREFSDEAKLEEKLLEHNHGNGKKDSTNRHIKRHHSVTPSNSDAKLVDLEKEVDNLRWFLHQMFEEQERLKEENKKQKRAIHKLANSEKRKHNRGHQLTDKEVDESNSDNSSNVDLKHRNNVVTSSNVETSKDSKENFERTLSSLQLKLENVEKDWKSRQDRLQRRLDQIQRNTGNGSDANP